MLIRSNSSSRLADTRINRGAKLDVGNTANYDDSFAVRRACRSASVENDTRSFRRLSRRLQFASFGFSAVTT